MVKTAIACLSVIVATVFTAGCGNSGMTVMSYNIRHGRGMDDVVDLDRIAAVIARQNPDVVALQEVDSYWQRSLCENQTRRLAEKLKMHYAWGPNVITRSNCKHCTVGLYGNAVLSKHPITKVRNHRLYQQADEEVRGCLETHIMINGKEIAFFATHLDATGPEEIRIEQSKQILDLIGRKDIPVILAGDINSHVRPDPDIETAAELFCKALYDTANVNPQQKAVGTLQRGHRIDFIFVSEELAGSVLSYNVITTDLATLASDHFPIVSVLGK